MLSSYIEKGSYFNIYNVDISFILIYISIISHIIPIKIEFQKYQVFLLCTSTSFSDWIDFMVYDSNSRVCRASV